MAEDFNIFTEDDKKHVSYGLCVLGMTATGMTLGSMAGGQTLLGGVGGTVWGLFTCKHLAEPIKQRLFSQSSRLTDAEFKQVFVAARRQFPFATKNQLFDLIMNAKLEGRRFPSRYQC